MKLPLETARLAPAEVTAAGSVEYDASPISAAGKVKAARRILVCIHGFLGDTRALVAGLHALAGSTDPLYDLVLAFDYENINTAVEITARKLKESLDKLGLAAGHGKQVHLVAHSLGCLVARWFIEREGGCQVVEKAVLVAPPNAGTPWARIQDLVTFSLGAALNGLALLTWPPGAIPLLIAAAGAAIGGIEAVDTSLDEMKAGSDFYALLNSSPDPGTPYTLIAGNTARIAPARPAGDNALETLARRLVSLQTRNALLSLAFFGKPNDMAVSLESMLALPAGRKPAPQVVEVACDHLSYFTAAAGQQALAGALAPGRHIGDSAVPLQPVGQAGVCTQVALVVGIDHYAGFTGLENACCDARELARLLHAEFGFTLLPGGTALLEGGATLDAIRQAVLDSLAAASAGTRWLFYFAGHGTVVNQQGYLIPAGAVQGSLTTYLSLQWLREQCLRSACGEALIILDACYSGQALVRSSDLDDTIVPGQDTERIIQLVSSGNPDQPVLDGGGSGHSVFTQSLLEALQGWSGIHDLAGGIYTENGVRFSSLLDHLVFDVPGRLRALRLHAASQRPVGGYLLRCRSEQRDFTFQPRVPRLPAPLVQNARSDDSAWREKALVSLGVYRDQPALRPLAAGLAAAHTRRRGGKQAPFLVSGFLYYEPEAAVRARAAETLCRLGDPAFPDALLAALDDEAQVCRAAARALGELRAAPAGPALLERLQQAPDELFLDLVDAVAALGDLQFTLPALRLALQRKKLVPFIGPDFPQKDTGLPERARLAQGLAARDGVKPGGSLAEVAARTMRGTPNVHAYTAYLYRELDDQLRWPGDIHRALAQWQLPLWLSGAYDGLLDKAVGGYTIVNGEDTRYWTAGRPTVVRIAGDAAGRRSLVVRACDYESLREDEGDRRLLLNFLRQELAGKLVLFLGHDPNYPDFDLLVRHVLDGHLAGVDVRAVLAWPEAGPEYAWSGHVLRPLYLDGLKLVRKMLETGPSKI